MSITVQASFETPRRCAGFRGRTSMQSATFLRTAHAGRPPLFIATATIGGGDRDAAARRRALEARGAVVEDWPLVGESAAILGTSRTDVLLVSAMAFTSELSMLIQTIGRQSSPYLIVLLENPDVADSIVALELGADDFLDRESDPREIMARANRLVRRGQSRIQPPASAGRPWVLNGLNRLLISPQGTVCELTKGELDLLSAFATESSPVAFSEMNAADTNRMRVAVSRFRRKFQRVCQEQFPIRNVWGTGYAFDAPLRRLYLEA